MNVGVSASSCFLISSDQGWHPILFRCTSVGQGTQALTMTLPDCVRVARGLFVEPSTLYFRDLIATVKDQARNMWSGRIGQDGGRGLIVSAPS